MQFYPECGATMNDIEMRMKTMDDEWSVSGEVGTEACVVNVIFREQEETESESEEEDEKCYHCNATAGLVWTEGYGGVHVCGFCKTIEDNACGECDRQNDGTFKTGEDGFLRCPDCDSN